MDQRETFSNEAELLSVISRFFEQKLLVSLLIDQQGLSRIEGYISAIEISDDIRKTTITVSDNKISLEEIIAANGLFRSDYSEC